MKQSERNLMWAVLLIAIGIFVTILSYAESNNPDFSVFFQILMSLGILIFGIGLGLLSSVSDIQDLERKIKP
jgi:sugar phosphate permease